MGKNMNLYIPVGPIPISQACWTKVLRFGQEKAENFQKFCTDFKEMFYGLCTLRAHSVCYMNGLCTVLENLICIVSVILSLLLYRSHCLSEKADQFFHVLFCTLYILFFLRVSIFLSDLYFCDDVYTVL